MRKSFKYVTSLALAFSMVAGLAMSGSAAKADDAQSSAVALQPWSLFQSGTTTAGATADDGNQYNKWEKCFFEGAIAGDETLTAADFPTGTFVGDGVGSDAGQQGLTVNMTKPSDNLKLTIGSTGWEGKYDNGVLVGNNPWTLRADMNGIKAEAGHIYTISFKLGWEAITYHNDNANKDVTTAWKGADIGISNSYTETYGDVTTGAKYPFLNEVAPATTVYVKNGETVDCSYKIENYADGADINVTFSLGAFMKPDNAEIAAIAENDSNAKGNFTISEFTVTDEGLDPEYVPEPPVVLPTTKPDEHVSTIITDPTKKDTTVTKSSTLATPKKLKVKKISKKAIKITWKKVANAKKYLVKVGKKSYKVSKAAKTVKNLKKGKYTIKVKALKNGAFAASKFTKAKKITIK